MPPSRRRYADRTVEPHAADAPSARRRRAAARPRGAEAFEEPSRRRPASGPAGASGPAEPVEPAAAEPAEFIPADPYAELDPVAQERPSARRRTAGNCRRSTAAAAGRAARRRRPWPALDRRSLALARRRWLGGERRAACAAARVAQARAPGAGRGGGGRSRTHAHAGGGRRFTRARVAALVALAVAIALVWFLLSLFQPFAGSGTGKVIVQIPKGSSSSKIGTILAHDHVISSGFFFNIRATLEGKRGSLHSGRFQLKHDMSYSAAIEALSKPPPKVIAVKVVIPEGYTRRQIADLVGEDALSGSYLSATVHSKLLSPKHYGAPSGTSNLEGFLFPATYELTAGAPCSGSSTSSCALFANASRPRTSAARGRCT